MRFTGGIQVDLVSRKGFKSLGGRKNAGQLIKLLKPWMIIVERLRLLQTCDCNNRLQGRPPLDAQSVEGISDQSYNQYRIYTTTIEK